MPVSLNNRRNTRIVETFADHPSKSTKVRAKVELFHHGKNTCTLIYDSHGGLYAVHIDTCGYDTTTTRGKINLFLAKFACQLCLTLYHKRGQLRVRHFIYSKREDVEFSRCYSVENIGRSAA